MKNYTMVLCTFLLLMSCSSTKQISDGTSEGVAGDGELTGTVRVGYKGCATLVETKGEQGKMILLYPVSLSDEFKKEGTIITFTMVPSRAMLPAECAFADKTVVLENVKKK
jgi:hypothetical protein